MTTSTPRYICTPGARYHARPLTLMQQEVLYLCTYGATLARLCQDTFYPPIQVAQILDHLMQHGLVTLAPAAEEAVWQRA